MFFFNLLTVKIMIPIQSGQNYNFTHNHRNLIYNDSATEKKDLYLNLNMGGFSSCSDVT